MSDVKIIQSFAHYEEGNSYLSRRDKNPLKSKETYHKNFYTFLLSYLTIKKYAGSVTMVCNKKAYDTLLKYIPYDDFVILENKRTFDYWNLYKVDAMMHIDGDVLHVDPDVMIFDNLFDSFLYDENVDTIVQHKALPHKNFLDEFVIRYRDFLIENDILDLRRYDRCGICSAVFGLREKHKKFYYEKMNLIHDKMVDGEMSSFYKHHNPIVAEEFLWYLVITKLKLNAEYVLPYELMKKYGGDERKIGDIVKYTHLWLGTRFNDDVLKLVKNKLKNDFPEYVKYVTEYEKNIQEFREEIIV